MEAREDTLEPAGCSDATSMLLLLPPSSPSVAAGGDLGCAAGGDRGCPCVQAGGAAGAWWEVFLPVTSLRGTPGGLGWPGRARAWD